MPAHLVTSISEVGPVALEKRCQWSVTKRVVQATLMTKSSSAPKLTLLPTTGSASPFGIDFSALPSFGGPATGDGDVDSEGGDLEDVEDRVDAEVAEVEPADGEDTENQVPFFLSRST